MHLLVWTTILLCTYTVFNVHILKKQKEGVKVILKNNVYFQSTGWKNFIHPGNLYKCFLAKFELQIRFG